MNSLNCKLDYKLSILLISIAISKFIIIALVFSPYFIEHEKTNLYILQTISVTGVGLSGCYDLIGALNNEKYIVNERKFTSSCILFILYSVPFISVCWMINIITTNDNVTNEEYNISIYIAICYFFTVFIIISGLCFCKICN